MTKIKPGMVYRGSNFSQEQLEKLLNTRSTWYYFLRWVHSVSGIVDDLAKIESDPLRQFPSPEGQAFDAKVEVRWKKRGDGYDVLWLGTETFPDEFDLKEVEGDWESEVRNAQLYPETETRLPKGVKTAKQDIQQRYFRDTRTSTIHFIALTVKSK